MTRRCRTFVCHLCHRFAKEQRYGPARTASLFNITQRTLQACIGVCLCMRGWSPFHVESAAARSRQMTWFCVPDSAMLYWLTRSHVSMSTCAGAASLQDAQATLTADLVAACRAKAGLDSPYFSPEQVRQQQPLCLCMSTRTSQPHAYHRPPYLCCRCPALASSFLGHCSITTACTNTVSTTSKTLLNTKPASW